MRTRSLLLVAIVVMSAVACSSDRTRNAGAIPGAQCTKSGEVMTMSSSTLVCGRKSGKSTWFNVSPALKGAAKCRPLGSTKQTRAGLRVCGRQKSRNVWFSVVAVPAFGGTAVPLDPSQGGAGGSKAGTDGAIGDSTKAPVPPTGTTTIAGNIAESGNPADISALQVAPRQLTVEGVSWDVPTRVWSSDGAVSIPLVRSPSGRRATYTISDAGATGCTLDVETMVLAFGAAGDCRLSAELAQSDAYVGESISAGVVVVDACRAGYSCRVGETGPSGGTVIHAASQPQDWGTYIELAPSGWADEFVPSRTGEAAGSESIDPKISWCPEKAGALFYSNSAGVGQGVANTDAMARASCRAATFVAGLSRNGVDDWVIPSSGDLELVCSFLKAGATRSQCRGVNEPLADELGFSPTATHYWSSSVDYNVSVPSAVGRRMVSLVSSMTTFKWNQDNALWIRPVRYFGPRTQSNFQIGPRWVDFGSPTTLFAWGGTGDGAVSFTVVDKGTANCSINSGKIESTDIGTCAIVATKAASGQFVESTSSPFEVTVRRAKPRIYVRAYYGWAGRFQEPITLEVFLSPYIDKVAFTVVDDRGTGCTVSGYELRAPTAGKCVVEASFAGDRRYEPGKSLPFEATFMQSCETGGDCHPGSIGPGGGTVFFMTGPRSWFTDFRTGQGARYLELAPADWSSRTSAKWGCEKVQITEADSRNPGGGGANTDQFLKQCLDFDNVFKLAANYRGGDKADWYVPSSIELNELCKYARGQLVGNFNDGCATNGALREGFEPGVYWSSTQYGSTLADAQLFGPSEILPRLAVGSRTRLNKAQLGFVRPIRSFCAGYCPFFPTTTTSNPAG